MTQVAQDIIGFVPVIAKVVATVVAGISLPVAALVVVGAIALYAVATNWDKKSQWGPPLGKAVIGATTTLIPGAILIPLMINIAKQSFKIANEKIKSTPKASKTVDEILKNKKGSIKNAPLPPGSPGWDEIAFLTLEEIRRLAQQNKPGFKTILKLLTDGRFNK